MKRLDFIKILLVLSACLPFAAVAEEAEVKKSFQADEPCTVNVSDNLAHVVWYTSSDSAGYVKVSSSEDDNFKKPVSFYDSNSGIKNIGKFHSVRIEGLKPDTKYSYMVYSVEVGKDGNGRLVSGQKLASLEPREFSTTGPKERESLTLYMINDQHEHGDRVEHLLKNSNGVDFIVYNGDMVNNMRSADQMRECCYLPASRVTKLPIHYIRGNHETRGRYAGEFLRISPCEAGRTFYSFRYGKVFFVVLDVGEDKCDSDEEYFGMANFDEFRSSQAKWLESVCESPEFKNADARVIICHVPVDIRDGSWHGQLHFYKQLAPVVNGKGFDIFLAGHYHRNLLVPPSPKGFDMPIVINGDKEGLRVKFTGKNIEVESVDMNGDFIKVDYKADRFPKRKK